MTTRQIYEHYLISTTAALITATAIHPAAGVIAFIAASAIQTHQSQHKQRP